MQTPSENPTSQPDTMTVESPSATSSREANHSGPGAVIAFLVVAVLLCLGATSMANAICSLVVEAVNGTATYDAWDGYPDDDAWGDWDDGAGFDLDEDFGYSQDFGHDEATAWLDA